MGESGFGRDARRNLAQRSGDRAGKIVVENAARPHKGDCRDHSAGIVEDRRRDGGVVRQQAALAATEALLADFLDKSADLAAVARQVDVVSAEIRARYVAQL